MIDFLWNVSVIMHPFTSPHVNLVFKQCSQVYLDGFVTFTNDECPPREEADPSIFPPLQNLDKPQFSAFAGKQVM